MNNSHFEPSNKRSFPYQPNQQFPSQYPSLKDNFIKESHLPQRAFNEPQHQHQISRNRFFGREINTQQYPSSSSTQSSLEPPAAQKNPIGFRHPNQYVKTRTSSRVAAQMERQMSVEEVQPSYHDENSEPNHIVPSKRIYGIPSRNLNPKKMEVETSMNNSRSSSIRNYEKLQQQQQQQLLLPQHPPTLSHQIPSSAAAMMSMKSAQIKATQMIQIEDMSSHHPHTHTEPIRYNTLMFDKDRLETNPIYQHARGIYNYLKHSENDFKAKGTMSSIQSEITVKMRAILIDWLIDVHLKFKLNPETLYLAVNLIDRFIERKFVPKDQLQLIGSTAMFVACKFEEIYPPELSDFVFICDNLYTKEQILAKEGELILLIDFNLTYTSPLRFLHRYSYLNNSTEAHLMCAQYLLELALLEYNFLQFSQSNQAASALYLVNKIFNLQTPWSEDARIQSSYETADLKACAKEFWLILQKANEFQAKDQSQMEEVQKNEDYQLDQLNEWYFSSKELTIDPDEISSLDIEFAARKVAISNVVKEFKAALQASQRTLAAVIRKYSLPSFAEAAKLLNNNQ